MKKTVLLPLLISTVMVSCSNDKAKKMLYDYQQKDASSLNFDLKDLDFKVQNIKKVVDITASDSMEYLKAELAQYWKKDAEQSLIDTLSFEYMKSVVNKSIAHQDTVIFPTNSYDY